jgi:hypothetical protein
LLGKNLRCEKQLLLIKDPIMNISKLSDYEKYHKIFKMVGWGIWPFILDVIDFDIIQVSRINIDVGKFHQNE